MREFSKTIIVLVFLLTSALHLTAGEVEFVWKERANSKSATPSLSPMKSIQQEVAQSVARFFEPRKPVDITDLIPKEVSKPSEPRRVEKPALPEKIDFKQGKYETKKDYEKRFNAAKEKQEAELKRKQEWYLSAVQQRNEIIDKRAFQYQQKVKKRNEQLLELQQKLDADYAKIKQEQILKETKLDRYLTVFFKNAFKKYLENPRVVSTNYYVNDETMQIVLGSSSSGYKQDFEFKLSPAEAQKMDKHLSAVKPDFHYTIVSEPKKNSMSIKLKEVVLKFDGKEYYPTIGTKSRQSNFLTASLTIENPEDITVDQQKLTLQDESIALHKQDMSYEKKAFAVRSDGENEILQRLSKMKEAKEDRRKWLVVIGIENYVRTDAIIYSKKSAYTYTKVMQKLLGVSEGHTLSLINEQATSSGIKIELDKILSRVKKGDTLYFYYSGHGIPVPEEKNEPYMLAQDMSAEYVQDNKYFRLKNIYKKLSNTKAKKVIAVVDSCFSGSTDGKSAIKGVAATALVAKKVDGYDKKKMVILTAGKDTQYSNKYDDKQQRLFSYYIMDALLKKDRKVKDVHKYAEYHVEETSQDLKMKKQTPVYMGNAGLSF
ncbi:MAG: caspase family protein [Sulfurimonadaceae bacterium]